MSHLTFAELQVHQQHSAEVIGVNLQVEEHDAISTSDRRQPSFIDKGDHQVVKRTFKRAVMRMHDKHAHHLMVRTVSKTGMRPAIAREHAARYIACMNSRSNLTRSTTARLIAILSLGLLLRAPRT